jgi:hypothetical protein
MSQPRGRPFEPGNTFGRGRPKGSPNKITKKMQAMLCNYSEPLLGKCIAMALKGDRSALKMCVERLFPARRDGLVQMPRLAVQTAADIEASSERVLQAISRSQITPTEGETISRILEERRRVIETVALEARIQELEETMTEQQRKKGNE